MTMRSPLRTERLMSFSTWNWPYHLCTPSMWIITSAERTEPRGFSPSCRSTSVVALIGGGSLGSLSALVAGVQAPLQVDGVARHGEAEHEVDHGDEEEGLKRR